MFLSNLTSVEIGQQHVLGLKDSITGQEGKSKFIIAESIYGMFCYFSKNCAFDFVANVMANLACQAEGRKFMIENSYIETISALLITK